MTEFPSTGKIAFKGKYGNKQGKLIVRPIPDGMGGYKGLPEDMDAEELTRLLGKKFDENYGIAIDSDTVLDLDKNKKDKLNWNWIKECPEIGVDEDAAKSSEVILYFVDRPDMKHEARMKKIKDTQKANGVIFEMSHEKRSQLMKYLGQPASVLSEREIEEYLFTEAANSPAKILRAVADPHFKEHLFVVALIDAGHIKKQASGHFKFGDVILGVNMESAIDFVKDPQNRDTVAYLFGLLKGKTADQFSSIVDELTAETK